MTRLDLLTARRLTVLAAAAGLVTAVLVTAATANAGDRRPEFPLSVAQAKERAEARFQTLDADGSGEISPVELAAGDFRGPHMMRRHIRFHAPPDGESATGSSRGHHVRFRAPLDDERGGTLIMKDEGPAPDAELFERLDANGDELLSKDEFTSEKLHEARRALMQERMFAHLDTDGSGGLSRDELPDMSRRLEAMDTDDDGVVTRQEAREHRHGKRLQRGGDENED